MMILSTAQLPEVSPPTPIGHIYFYIAAATIVALILVIKSNSRYKFEMFFIATYLLTGNLNNVLTFKIPGFSLFEIQPVRFIFLLLSFFILRKSLLASPKSLRDLNMKMPWFMLAVFAYVVLVILSVAVNRPEMELSDVFSTVYDSVAFLVLLFGLRVMEDVDSYKIVGTSIIIGAVVSSVVSLIQFGIDPYFLRVGDQRAAFAGYLRSNGIFSTEYFNSYYLITAMVWTLITIRHQYLKLFLIVLFVLGVISSFQRMSWLITAVVLATYLIYVQRLPLAQLAALGFAAIALLISISIFYYQDIMNSALVRERLSDSIEGRTGYYKVVLNNIADRPVFGYGDLKNDVYYTNILRITGNRTRATAEAGDLHSGYFSSMFLYGIPAFVSFVLFVVLSVVYYAQKYKENIYYAIPLFVSIIYLIGNLTNTFLFLKYISIIYAIHIGIGMGLSNSSKPLRPNIT